jgi:HTH-type transcriptional regulator, sugar sensing transcriptional regulator
VNTSPLVDLGLTNTEISVYLALLDLGKTKSGAIVDRTKLHPSVIFLALHTLKDKGLLTTIRAGKTALYVAADPAAFVSLADSRKQNVEKLVPQLRARKTTITSEGAELYEGIRGIQALFFSLIEDAKKGDEFFYFDAEEHGQEERAELVYLPFHARAKEKGVLVRGIQRRESKTKQSYGSVAMLRFTDQVIPPDTSIFKDKLVLVTWSETPKGVVITSALLANQYRKVWLDLWNSLG